MKIGWYSLILVLLTLTLFGEQGAYRFYQLKAREQSIQSQNETLLAHNRELVGEIQRLREPENLERLIREEMGYIREDERLLEIPKSP